MGKEKETSSTHRSVTSAGVHRFRIDGHSLVARSDKSITSSPFRVGGHEWTIRYYPKGNAEAGGLHVSVFLCLNDAGQGDVTASFSFCIQGPSSPTTEEKNKVGYTYKFSPTVKNWGANRFMSKADLAASGCLKGDSLVIKCTVEVITSELIKDNSDGGIVVPPPELSKHLGHLLETGLATDITIQIGGANKFKAHQCVLAARSPVFRALLCGAMMESKRNNICIEDMDAGVFKVLMYYMYHEDLPAVSIKEASCTEEETTNMAQHVLVEADRYGMDRLKLMCESKLSKTVDVGTVCSTLDFADRHHCEQLKNFCLEYMAKDLGRLKAIVKTQGFEQLNQNCPSVACEILVKALEIN